jgi:predicted DNA-binding protein (MmcQ/YjbR family)
MSQSELEKLCLSLNGTTIDIKWGNDLCFLVGGKMYCVTTLAVPMKVSIKVLPEEFDELTERTGIIPAPYMARNKWVFIEKSTALTPKEWKHYVQQSYNLVFDKLTKKLKDSIGKIGKT